MRKRFLVGMALFALGGVAQDVMAEEAALEVGNVVVKGKVEQQPPYSATLLPASTVAIVEEFSREDIQSLAPATIYDLAALSLGARVEFQGRKGPNTVQVRGGDTLGVILDGVYLPWSQASRILAQFPVDAIESVRIVRDSSAVTLGPFVTISPAMSHDNVPSPGLGSSNQGFMVITTKHGKGLELGGIASYGNLNTGNFQLYAGNSIGAFSYRLVGNSARTSGVDGWNNSADNRSALLNANYDGAGLKGDLMAYYSNGKRELERATEDSTAYTSLWSYDPINSLQLAFNLHKLWNAANTTSLSYSLGRVTDGEILGVSTKPALPAAVHQEEQLDSLHLWHTIASENNRLAFGLQSFRWKSPTGQFFYEGTSRKEDIISGYAQDEYRMNKSLTLDGGIRVDGKLIEQGSDKYSPLQDTNKKISNEWEKPSISLSLGSSYKLDERHNLLARFGYSRQEPDSFLATVGNKTLDTEQRLKYELGAEGKYNPAFNPGVTMFYYDIQNFAYSAGTGGNVAAGTSYNIYDTANVGRKGVEATVKGSLPLGFGYNVGYSYITTDRADTNKVMPHNMVNLRLSHQLGALETNLILNYVSSYENNFLSNVDPVTKQAIYRPAGDYTRLDMNVSYSFKLSDAKAKATLYGRNLFDDRYVTIAGWRDQGLTYGGKLEVSF